MDNTQVTNQVNVDQQNTDLSGGFHLLNDFYVPLKNQQAIYNSNAYKTLLNNNVDPIELLGVQKDPSSQSIVINNKTTYPLEEATKRTAYEIGKNVSQFLHDMPAAAADKLVNGVMQGAILAVNLAPIANKVVGSPVNQDVVMQNSIATSNSLKDTLKNLNEDFKKGFNAVNGRDINSASELVGYIAQDAPYTIPIYKGLKKIPGISDTTATFLAFGIGSSIAFAPEESSITLNMFTQEIDSVKKFLNILPNTPNNELFNRGVQLFEGTAIGKFLPEIVNVGKFLKKYVPEYAPIQQTAVATAGATAANEAVKNISDNIQNNIISSSTKK